MDKLTRYREAVKKCLLDWYDFTRRATPKNGTEVDCLIDEERDNYMLTFTGWHNGERKRTDFLFLRIRDGKVWIEENRSDDPLVGDLQRAGVPKEDIVLAFHPPELRHLTEFAVA